MGLASNFVVKLDDKKYMFSILVPQEFFAAVMLFARVGTVLIQMPTIGETYIPMRVRAAFGVLLTLVMLPVLRYKIPAIPEGFLVIAHLIFIEILIGIFLGSLMRLFVFALSTTGTIMSFVSGFAAAQAFNPLMQGQGSLHSVMLTLTATVVILATDVHHLMIMAIVDSYQLFEPGVLPIVEDMTNTYATAFAKSFKIGMQFASPFVLAAILYNVLLGLMARLMPNLQVFFVAMPLQILLGLILFGLILSSIMIWFMRYFTESLAPFIVIGG